MDIFHIINTNKQNNKFIDSITKFTTKILQIDMVKM